MFPRFKERYIKSCYKIDKNRGLKCKALPGCTVGSRQAEHESQGELIEEDDMVKSRVGNTLVQETNQWGRKEATSPRSI